MKNMVKAIIVVFGMAGSLKQEVGQKCRWFGWFLLGVICMYGGMHLSILYQPQHLQVIAGDSTWSYSAGTVQFGKRKDFVFKKIVATHPAKLRIPEGKSRQNKDN